MFSKLPGRNRSTLHGSATNNLYNHNDVHNKYLIIKIYGITIVRGCVAPRAMVKRSKSS